MSTTPQDLATRQSRDVRDGRDSRDARDARGDTAIAALVPPVDVVEDDAGITVTADMPGASKDKLAIDVNGDTLTIDAPFTLGESGGMQALYAEVRTPHYRRSFTLSRELDTTRIDASLKDGVLQLRVPKLEAARPRRIEVRAG